MELKYVGAKPIVSKNGVSFNQTEPDPYIFIGPAIEILASLEEVGTDEEGILDMSKYSGGPFGEKLLSEKVLNYCEDINELSEKRESLTNQMIDDYVKGIEKNATLTPDERRAWLGNVSIMRPYYLQHVSNELVYNCLLERIAQRLAKEQVIKIYFPLDGDYGLVLSHLIHVLTHHKPPMDATLSIAEKLGETYGVFDTNRPKPKPTSFI